MTEQAYQSKIIKSIEADGGVVVNGTYSKAGIADLVCGYPIELTTMATDSEIILQHLHVEVKTKEAYEKLMRNNIEEVEGLYICKPWFKGREVLQAHKLNEVRKRGGLALFAYSYLQVKEYIDEYK